MSSDDTEQYRQFIEKLQHEENRPEVLNDIKHLFTFKPVNDVREAITNVGISEIIKCLNATDKSHVDLTCEVLRVCFDKFNVGHVIINYTSHIMYLLRHQKGCVRRLAVDEVCKAVVADPDLLPVPQYVDLYVAVGQLVCDEDVGVANKSILITSNLPVEAYPRVLDEMKFALQCSTSAKCNAFEVVINISSKSTELMQLCIDAGYFEAILTDLKTTDVLYQLNILELISKLAVKPHGIKYLVEQGILERTSDLVRELQINPLGGILIPGFMKFFGCIAHHYPRDVFERYPTLLNMLFDQIKGDDPAVLPVALDTLGFIGSTIEGKLCLAALGSQFTLAIDRLAQLIRNSTTEIKLRALYCFASLIGIESDPITTRGVPVDHRVTLMSREWFRTLSSGSMDVVFDMCKNPFDDIKMAALTLLDAVTQHHWGEELLANTAGFIEYLLDRSVDCTKESNEAKYEIMKRLASSSAFDTNITSRLQTYVEQGPFFSESIMQVAMEEEN